MTGLPVIDFRHGEPFGKRRTGWRAAIPRRKSAVMDYRTSFAMTEMDFLAPRPSLHRRAGTAGGTKSAIDSVAAGAGAACGESLFDLKNLVSG
ncbi:MAG: hypothetical protein MUP33_01660 [Polaromonas sp.]|nr:hypothetical protein [Polaromonas sp.]